MSTNDGVSLPVSFPPISFDPKSEVEENHKSFITSSPDELSDPKGNVSQDFNQLVNTETFLNQLDSDSNGAHAAIHESDLGTSDTPEKARVSGDQNGHILQSSRKEGQSVQELIISHDEVHIGLEPRQTPDNNMVDPTWGTDSRSFFHDESVIERTNSFPSMEKGSMSPSKKTVSENNPTQSSYQGNPLDLETSNTNIGRFNSGFLGGPTSQDDDIMEDGLSDQLKTQTKPIFVPSEAELRFDEGIPLVGGFAPPVEDPGTKQPGVVDKIFDEDNDEGVDFFNSASQDAFQTQIPAVTRKSTSQVLESFHFTQDSPVTEAPLDSFHTSGVEDATQTEDTRGISSEDDLAARWQTELEKDDDFLLDDKSIGSPLAGQPYSEITPNGLDGSHPVGGNNHSSELESGQDLPIESNLYTPHQPSSAGLVQTLSTPPHTDGSFELAAPLFQSQVQQPLALEKTESFSNRSKDGYKSPYDLPEDLSRPRRQVMRKTASSAASNASPPPRSSNIAAISPPVVPRAVGVTTEPALTPKNFYEEPLSLPRQRPATSGQYSPRSNAAAASVSVTPSQGSAVGVHDAMPPSVADSANDTYYHSQLYPPEPLSPYANLTIPSKSTLPNTNPRYSPNPTAISPGTRLTSSRYSPAPPAQSHAITTRNRYASQPVSVQSSNAHPFQPRTSSPLAHHEKLAYRSREPKERPLTSSGSFPSPRLSQPQKNNEQSPLAVAEQPSDSVLGSTYSILGVQSNAEKVSETSTYQPNTPPKNPYPQNGSAMDSSESGFAYSIQDSSHALESSTKPQIAPPVHDTQFGPLRRSQTQSPSRQISGLSLPMTLIEPFQRPASAHGPSSPSKAVNPYTVPQIPSKNRDNRQQLEFIPPTDGHQLDPLERWKGAAIFKFGFGGVVTTCFPKHAPRYAAGHPTPIIKSTPGEVKLHQLKDFLPLVDNIVRYPGPLKAKSKKKDVIAWLSGKLAAFENEGLSEAVCLHPEPHTRHDEKIILWKIIRIMVEHDGVLEGTADVQQSLCDVISPGIRPSESSATSDGFLTSSAYQPSNISFQPDAVDSRLLEVICKDLLLGDREKAVWRAVDNRLWGHAMVLSSTLDRSVWRQVVQEFVRREVRSVGGNVESLAALYEVFAGNLEESVDELVPPSARAGLRMISKSAAQGPTKNALSGLDRWRDTLGLILSNRSPNDHQALFALGRLLSSYGRVEASHICYLFARTSLQAQIFGGTDDPQASIVLLGADHQRFPSTYYLDEDAVLLTEVYEFATAVLAGSPIHVLPHLQAFKLQHAITLAERGFTVDAQQYCDVIGGNLKATTKLSPYYHPCLFSELDELSRRVRRAPNEVSSSWISKPSMEKVSGSMWAKFNSFVAGDDSDAGSTGSGKGDGDVGPFAKVAGTPTISRTPSVSDLYGAYPMTQPHGTSSRYTPGGQYAPASSPEQYRSRSSIDSQRSSSIGYSHLQRRSSQEHVNSADNNLYTIGVHNPHSFSSVAAYHSTPPQSSYMPLAPVEEDLHTMNEFQPEGLSLQETLPSDNHGANSDAFDQSPINHDSSGITSSRAANREQPRALNTYEPPSYQSDVPSAPDDLEGSPQEEKKPKKKPFMDDDDDGDLAIRAAAIQKADKERRNRETDEAFRRAAEADAKKPVQPTKKGWFGSWFGGKKDDISGGPVKAKLGEENSFYYDANLKRWVNKKDADAASATAHAAPPPPKGSASRSRSASGGNVSSAITSADRTPSAPRRSFSPSMTSVNVAGENSRSSLGIGDAPSHTGSPSLSSIMPPPSAPNGIPPRSVSTGAAVATRPSSSSGSIPPRPATSLSNASSIDDLLGAPQARKGNSVRAKKKGRGYVDVMKT